MEDRQAYDTDLTDAELAEFYQEMKKLPVSEQRFFLISNIGEEKNSVADGLEDGRVPRPEEIGAKRDQIIGASKVKCRKRRMARVASRDLFATWSSASVLT